MTMEHLKRKEYIFSQVSNEVLRDKNITMKAKGLYALIQSYITIENFVLYKNTLKKDCKEGEKAFEAAWKELKDKGYLVQCKLRNEKGGFYYEYDLLDTIHTPKKEGVDHNPKKEGVEKEHLENGGSGKGGIYNNTDSTNTNFNNTDRKNSKSSLPSPIENFFNSIKSEMTEVSYKTWIEPLEIKQEGNKIQVITSSDFTKTMIKNKFIELIEIHLKKYFEFEHIEVVVEEKLKEG
jgi:hypothetical protein